MSSFLHLRRPLCRGYGRQLILGSRPAGRYVTTSTSAASRVAPILNEMQGGSSASSSSSRKTDIPASAALSSAGGGTKAANVEIGEASGPSSKLDGQSITTAAEGASAAQESPPTSTVNASPSTPSASSSSSTAATDPSSSTAGGTATNGASGEQAASSSTTSSTEEPSKYDSWFFLSKAMGTVLSGFLLYYLYKADWSIKRAEVLFINWLRTWPLYPPPSPSVAHLNANMVESPRLQQETQAALQAWFLKKDNSLAKGITRDEVLIFLEEELKITRDSDRICRSFLRRAGDGEKSEEKCRHIGVGLEEFLHFVVKILESNEKMDANRPKLQAEEEICKTLAAGSLLGNRPGGFFSGFGALSVPQGEVSDSAAATSTEAASGGMGNSVFSSTSSSGDGGSRTFASASAEPVSLDLDTLQLERSRLIEMVDSFEGRRLTPAQERQHRQQRTELRKIEEEIAARER
ncbi:unnamed protein product [Amoebophrya sp. A25]|nr:unnamed protein product [Amoebophrya sp. A25]|eukprot:GSA25T00002706001.1